MKARRDAMALFEVLESVSGVLTLQAREILEQIAGSRDTLAFDAKSDGNRLSPRDQLKDKDFETRKQYGLKVLRDYGVLK